MGTGDAIAEARAPMESWNGSVLPDWIDYNGHMTEHRYLQCFGEATDALLRRIGIDAAALAAGRSAYTVETHILHRGEARVGEGLRVATQVLGADTRRLHLFHRLTRAGDGALLASAEQMLLHVAGGRSAPASAPVREAAQALADAHASLPPPEGAGRAIAMRR